MLRSTASHAGYTLLELVSVIEKVLGLRVRVEHREQRNFDVPTLHLDSSAAAERLGWTERTPLEEGVRKNAEWLEALLKRGA